MNRLSYFQCDVTPPIGHPLMAGMGTAVASIADRQTAHGLILTNDRELPIVLLTLDWCLVSNEGYAAWRTALAQAAGTRPQRVFVHTVHQHDAVLADPGIERCLSEYGLAGHSLDLHFFQRSIEKVGEAARGALQNFQAVTHVAFGEAKVEGVASNRRIIRGEDEPVMSLRRSWCLSESMRAEPEGLIDPLLKTIAFYQGDTLLAALHHYATHPMSFYGEGHVSRDFCGKARDRLAEETGAPQLYFTGAAGNISAGKYNDGSPAMAEALYRRMLQGMQSSLKSAVREELKSLEWKVRGVHLAPRDEYPAEYYRSRLAGEELPLQERCHGAFGLAAVTYLEKTGYAIELGSLSLNDSRAVYMPGEPFIEYQLFAQQCAADKFVAVAAYGDGGPCYLPTARAYQEGGYETGPVAFTGPASEQAIRRALCDLLS